MLDARVAHPQASLADLHDPLTMLANLPKVHQKLDKAMDAACGCEGANADVARVMFCLSIIRPLPVSYLWREKSENTEKLKFKTRA